MPLTILINNMPYEVPKPAMTGEEIKELAGGPMDYWLVLRKGSPDPVAGEDNVRIEDEEAVDMQSGMQFRIINAATFGALQAA